MAKLVFPLHSLDLFSLGVLLPKQFCFGKQNGLKSTQENLALTVCFLYISETPEDIPGNYCACREKK